MRARRAWALITTAALAASLAVATTTASPAAAVAPTVAPTLTSPQPDQTVSANPVLSWNAVSGAAKYRVQISTTDTFGTLLYNKDTVGLQVTPDQDLPASDLYWRVAATDGGTGVGPFSDTLHFTKTQSAGPTLVTPTDGASLTFPTQPATFSWNPVPAAKSYTLQVDDASDFIGAQQFTTANTAYTLTEPQTVGQTFYWRVFATSPSNGTTLPSETRTYSFTWPSTPTLLAPANTTLSAITEVNFSWTTVAGAKTYQLQVSPNGDWANNRSIDVVVKGTKYSPPTTLDNGSYYWRVRAIDASAQSNYGNWSAAWQFTRGWSLRPTLTSPAWGGDPNVVPHIGELSLSWTPVTYASSYEIQISSDINFSPSTSVTRNCITNHTSWTPYDRIPLESNCSLDHFVNSTGTVYYWRVRGIDDPQGVLGLWSSTDNSNTFRFVRDPAVPAYASPADGATVETPSLSWTGVLGAEHYLVTITDSTGTTLSGYPVTTYATSYTPTKALNAAAGPFSWYVQSVDAFGVASSYPATNAQRTFQIAAPTTSTPLTLTAPVDTSSSILMPAMSWSAYPGAVKYTVRYAANNFQFVLGSNLPYTSYTDADVPLAPGSYAWWVEAYDTNGVSLAVSATRTFSVVAPDTLGSGGYLAPCDQHAPTCTAAVADTPRLQWAAAPGAGAYVVYIANDADFTNIIKTYKTPYTSLTPRESLVDNQAGQAFYWFVRPCVDASLTQCGPGPQDSTANQYAGSFEKRSNPIDTLSSTSTNGLISFSWRDFLDTNGASAVQATQEARQYHIEVSTSADFSAVIDSATVDQTTYTPFSKTYPEGPLFWHVQAIDGTGNALTYSTTATVTKVSPVPSLSSPVSGEIVSGVPLLQWTPVAFGAQYTVEVYKNGDTTFSSINRVVSATSKFSAYNPTTSLAAGDYTWRVRRLDADARPGDWSSTGRFTLQSQAPTLLQPGDNQSLNSNSILFSWTAVPRAVQYKWELSTSSAFASLTSSQTTVMTAWSPLGALPDGTTYWRVKVLDAAGNVIATSGVRTLRKDTTRPTLTGKTPTTSASITGTFTATFSEPVVGVSSSTFRLTVAGTSTTVAGTVTPSVGTPTTTATFRPSIVLVPGQSYTASVTSGITDVAGNPLVANSWTVRTSTTVENTSPALHEVWDQDTSASASGGAYHSSQTSGSVIRFSFTGTNAVLLGTRAAAGGYAYVYLDGVKQSTVLSFYSSTTRWQQTIWSKAGLANAAHTVEVRPTGTKPSAAKGAWVYVDAFKVGAVLYQENNAAVREYFRRVSTSSASAGSYDLATHVTSGDNGGRPNYSLAFKGTKLSVYATKSTSSGKAAIYVDGVLRSTVNLNGSTAYKVRVYSAIGLTNSVHSVRVDVLGTSSGSASSVGIDYFGIG